MGFWGVQPFSDVYLIAVADTFRLAVSGVASSVATESQRGYLRITLDLRHETPKRAHSSVG